MTAEGKRKSRPPRKNAPKSPRSRRPRGEANDAVQRAARMFRLLSVTTLVLVAIVTSSLVWLLLVYPNRPSEGSGEPVRLELPPGATLEDVVDHLDRAQLVDDPFVFSVYLRVLGASGRFREGRIALSRGLTPAMVARRVATGIGTVEVRVTIPEGFDSIAVAERLSELSLGERDDFIEAMRDPSLLEALDVPGPSLEGYLFPDTYDLRDDIPPREILGRMVQNHRTRTAPVFARHRAALDRLRAELSMSPHDVLTLASIVEKEAGVPEERPTIAGVFLNRLRSQTFRPRARLQADPTVSYGCRAEPASAPSCAGYDGRITRAMLSDAANRYNTYQHSGLPPSPIANPGLAAIEAVLAPDVHDYLFFVARGHRRHTFSETLDGHETGVSALREREGRR